MSVKSFQEFATELHRTALQGTDRENVTNVTNVVCTELYGTSLLRTALHKTILHRNELHGTAQNCLELHRKTQNHTVLLHCTETHSVAVENAYFCIFSYFIAECTGLSRSTSAGVESEQELSGLRKWQPVQQ